MKTTLRIFRILYKLLLLCYVTVVNIILISAFYVLLLLIVEWVAPSFLPGLFAEYSFAHHLVYSLPFYIVLLYIPVQPFTTERMDDADERGLQTAGR